MMPGGGLLNNNVVWLVKVAGEAGANSNGWSWEFHSDLLTWEFNFEALDSNTMEWESHSNFMI